MQEFCWSYRSKAAKLAARNQPAPDNAELIAAPMFCFEVCLELYLPQALLLCMTLRLPDHCDNIRLGSYQI